MPVELRELVIAASSGQPDHTGSSPNVQRKAAAFMRSHEQHDARVLRPDLRAARGEIPGADSAMNRHTHDIDQKPRKAPAIKHDVLPGRKPGMPAF